MNTFLKTGLTLIGRGLRELMNLVFILSIGLLAYYLVRTLPIDHMISITLSIGAGLAAAYFVYSKAKSVSTVKNTEIPKINPATGLPMIGEFDSESNPYGFDFSDTDPVNSYMADNINFSDNK